MSFHISRNQYCSNKIESSENTAKFSTSPILGEIYMPNTQRLSDIHTGQRTLEMSKQVFIVFRHGARYPINKPNHNILWPHHDNFWDQHLGKLSPAGVLQLSKLGDYIKSLYPWINDKNLNVYSTHMSRAIESAWSFVMGLLPQSPIQIVNISNSLNYTYTCSGPTCCNSGMVCIKYYDGMEENDPIFGNHDFKSPHRKNTTQSPYIISLSKSAQAINLINRLRSTGCSNFDSDNIGNIIKLKEIYSQIQIDEQLNIPLDASLINRYNLTSEDLDLINSIGLDVISRRSVPSSNLLKHDVYNRSQGAGLLKYINDEIQNWDGKNSFTVLSCHDSNIIALGSVLGLQVDSPDFGGYFLFERSSPVINIDNTIDNTTYNTTDNTIDKVGVYYNIEPFKSDKYYDAKVWPGHRNRDNFINWNTLETGLWNTPDFINMINDSLLSDN